MQLSDLSFGVVKGIFWGNQTKLKPSEGTFNSLKVDSWLYQKLYKAKPDWTDEFVAYIRLNGLRNTNINYASYLGKYYFLEQVNKYGANDYLYKLVYDFWVNDVLRNKTEPLSITGLLITTSNEQVVLDNLPKTPPLLDTCNEIMRLSVINVEDKLTEIKARVERLERLWEHSYDANLINNYFNKILEKTRTAPAAGENLKLPAILFSSRKLAWWAHLIKDAVQFFHEHRRHLKVYEVGEGGSSQHVFKTYLENNLKSGGGLFTKTHSGQFLVIAPEGKSILGSQKIQTSSVLELDFTGFTGKVTKLKTEDVKTEEELPKLGANWEPFGIASSEASLSNFEIQRRTTKQKIRWRNKVIDSPFSISIGDFTTKSKAALNEWAATKDFNVTYIKGFKEDLLNAIEEDQLAVIGSQADFERKYCVLGSISLKLGELLIPLEVYNLVQPAQKDVERFGGKVVQPYLHTTKNAIDFLQDSELITLQEDFNRHLLKGDHWQDIDAIALYPKWGFPTTLRLGHLHVIKETQEGAMLSERPFLSFLKIEPLVLTTPRIREMNPELAEPVSRTDFVKEYGLMESPNFKIDLRLEHYLNMPGGSRCSDESFYGLVNKIKDDRLKMKEDLVIEDGSEIGTYRLTPRFTTGALKGGTDIIEAWEGWFKKASWAGDKDWFSFELDSTRNDTLKMGWFNESLPFIMVSFVSNYVPDNSSDWIKVNWVDGSWEIDEKEPNAQKWQAALGEIEELEKPHSKEQYYLVKNPQKLLKEWLREWNRSKRTNPEKYYKFEIEIKNLKFPEIPQSHLRYCLGDPCPTGYAVSRPFHSLHMKDKYCSLNTIYKQHDNAFYKLIIFTQIPGTQMCDYSQLWSSYGDPHWWIPFVNKKLLEIQNTPNIVTWNRTYAFPNTSYYYQYASTYRGSNQWNIRHGLPWSNNFLKSIFAYYVTVKRWATINWQTILVQESKGGRNKATTGAVMETERITKMLEEVSFTNDLRGTIPQTWAALLLPAGIIHTKWGSWDKEVQYTELTEDFPVKFNYESFSTSGTKQLAKLPSELDWWDVSMLSKETREMAFFDLEGTNYVLVVRSEGDSPRYNLLLKNSASTAIRTLDLKEYNLEGDRRITALPQIINMQVTANIYGNLIPLKWRGEISPRGGRLFKRLWVTALELSMSAPYEEIYVELTTNVEELHRTISYAKISDPSQYKNDHITVGQLIAIKNEETKLEQLRREELKESRRQFKEEQNIKWYDHNWNYNGMGQRLFEQSRWVQGTLEVAKNIALLGGGIDPALATAENIKGLAKSSIRARAGFTGTQALAELITGRDLAERKHRGEVGKKLLEAGNRGFFENYQLSTDRIRAEDEIARINRERELLIASNAIEEAHPTTSHTQQALREKLSLASDIFVEIRYPEGKLLDDLNSYYGEFGYQTEVPGYTVKLADLTGGTIIQMSDVREVNRTNSRLKAMIIDNFCRGIKII